VFSFLGVVEFGVLLAANASGCSMYGFILRLFAEALFDPHQQN
jgi:hypothetical protein